MSARKTAARYRWLRFAKLSCPSWFGSWWFMTVTLLLSAMLFGVLHWIHGQCDESNGCLLNHGAWLELLLGWFFYCVCALALALDEIEAASRFPLHRQ